MCNSKDNQLGLTDFDHEVGLAQLGLMSNNCKKWRSTCINTKYAAGNQTAVYTGMPSINGQASALVIQYLAYNCFGKPESSLYPLNGAEAMV